MRIRMNQTKWHVTEKMANGETYVRWEVSYSEDAVKRIVAALNNELKRRKLKNELGEKIESFDMIKGDWGPVDAI